MKLVPYRVSGRLLLDVQQVIPLPEAEELTVRLRRRETAARAAEQAVGSRDWTQYVVTSPSDSTEPLRKRHAVLALLRRLHDAGVPAAQLATAMPGPRFLPIDGAPSADELMDAFVDSYPNAEGHLHRWHIDSPIVDDGRIWILSKQWGRNTIPTLDALLELAPTSGFGYHAAIG